jgi:phage tail tape-measure protein
MNNDPTVQEIWDVREKIWDECGGSFANLLKYYRQTQQEHPHKIVRLDQIEEEVAEI